MNDNLSLTYYYGNNGIPVIPNLRCGIDELCHEFFTAIPKNTIVAVGTHGFIKTKQEKYEWYDFLEMVIAELEPSSIVVYGTLNGEMFCNLKDQANIVCYDAWNDLRRKGVDHV